MKDTILQHIVTTSTLESEGFYDIGKHEQAITYKGKVYPYHSSGLCREVYISPCKTYVLKIPITNKYIRQPHDMEEVLDMYKGGGLPYILPMSVNHNILETDVVNECPTKYKKYFAQTELLPNGWVKQEYVKVKLVSRGLCREIGFVGKQPKFFDCDCFLSLYKRPEKGFDYEKWVEWIKNFE